MIYKKTTHNISVSVTPSFLQEGSLPREGVFLWAYQIRILNERHDPVRLIKRYWRVTDADGNTQKLEGIGVLGEQPLLEPGKVYEYASGMTLPTPYGSMCGEYEVQNTVGERLSIEIPAFFLESVFSSPSIH